MAKPFLVPMSQVPGYWQVGNRYGQELKNSPLFRSKQEAQQWIDEHPEVTQQAQSKPLGTGGMKMAKTTGRGRASRACECGAPAYPGKDRCASCAFADGDAWAREVAEAEAGYDKLARGWVGEGRVKELRAKYKGFREGDKLRLTERVWGRRSDQWLEPGTEVTVTKIGAGGGAGRYQVTGRGPDGKTSVAVVFERQLSK